MDNLSFLALIAILAVCYLVFLTARSKKDKPGSDQTGGAAPSFSPDRTTHSIVDDIRATKTSRIVDAVAVLEELDKTSPGFRQYCELTGTGVAQSTVVAPYSQRPVAYYDVRCYRITNDAGYDSETLVAHESSIEPVAFTDGSCDTPVYIDLQTFGSNVMLVNSSNHVEGPTSDFSNAFRAHTAGGGAGAYAFARNAVARAGNWLENLAARVRRLPGMAAPAPSFALAAAGAGATACVPVERREWTFVAPGPGDPGFGGPGGPGLGDFLGGFGGMSVPPGGRGMNSSNADEVLVGLGLGALLGTLASGDSQQYQQDAGSQFRGYRLVEDVVPLQSPIYCIGEIYKSAGQVHMGRSLAKDYPTSFFACKPEQELLSTLGAQM